MPDKESTALLTMIVVGLLNPEDQNVAESSGERICGRCENILPYASSEKRISGRARRLQAGNLNEKHESNKTESKKV
jgi:hypothetical protein